MKLFRILLIASLPVAAVLAIPPALIGPQVEKGLRAAVIEAGDNAVLEASWVSYDRSWFDAEGRLEVRLKERYIDMITNQTAADAQADGAASEAFLARLDEMRDALTQPAFVDVDVSHGLVLLHQGMRLALAGAVLTLDDTSVAALDTADLVNAIEMRLHVAFDQVVHFEGEVPPLTADPKEGHITVAGMVLSGYYTVSTEVVTFEGEGPLFMLTRPGGEALELRGVRTSGEYRKLDGSLWLGDGQITLDTLRSTLTEDGIAIALAAEGLRVSGGISPDQENRQLLNVTVRYVAERLTVDDVDASFDVPMSLEGMSREAMADYFALSADPQYQRFLADPEGSVPAPPVLNAFLDKLSADPPSLRLGPGEVIYDGSPVDFDVQASLASEVLRSTGFAGLADPATATQAAIVKAQVTVPMGVAEELAVFVLTDQLGASVGPGVMSAEQLAQLAAAQAPGMLEQLVQQGMLQREGDRYRAKVSLADGNLDLNGLVLPLGMFQ